MSRLSPKSTVLRLVLPALAAAAILAAPVPAPAAGTVRVEFYIGGVAACGAGFFIWFAQSWETGFVEAGPGRALVNLRGHHILAASPLSGLRWLQEPGSDGTPRDHYELELFNWQF